MRCLPRASGVSDAVSPPDRGTAFLMSGNSSIQVVRRDSLGLVMGNHQKLRTDNERRAQFLGMKGDCSRVRVRILPPMVRQFEHEFVARIAV